MLEAWSDVLHNNWGRRCLRRENVWKSTSISWHTVYRFDLTMTWRDHGLYVQVPFRPWLMRSSTCSIVHRCYSTSHTMCIVETCNAWNDCNLSSIAHSFAFFHRAYRKGNSRKIVSTRRAFVSSSQFFKKLFVGNLFKRIGFVVFGPSSPLSHV